MSGLFLSLGLIGALAVILCFFALIRYLNHKETIARIEKGLPHPEQKTRKGFLRWGILIGGLGFALSLGLYPIGFSAGNNYPLHLGPWMLGGFVPLFLGLGLILLHFLTQKD
ncbi:MAG: hypothetical protein EHM40_00200 [Chloroflexi bacterium]|nr:MAG: hypothetical protein EHM40_00200 [Chloroflexota bacterium]